MQNGSKVGSLYIAISLALSPPVASKVRDGLISIQCIPQWLVVGVLKWLLLRLGM